MKQIAFLFLLTIAMFSCRKQEQIPADANHEFNIVYGNSKSEQVFSAARSSDGAYVLAGIIKSVNGNQGNSDAWVLKLDSQGKIIWQKTFGGSAFDGANSVAATKDGGYVIGSKAPCQSGQSHRSHRLFGQEFRRDNYPE
ncbi:MAG: hypothetical protein ACXVKT_15565 [Flavisolibacter sp.]